VNKRQARIIALAFVLESVKTNWGLLGSMAPTPNPEDAAKIAAEVLNIVGPLEDRLRKARTSR